MIMITKIICKELTQANQFVVSLLFKATEILAGDNIKMFLIQG